MTDCGNISATLPGFHSALGLSATQLAAELCVALDISSDADDMSIVLPGGITITGTLSGKDILDPAELAQRLLADANVALAPFTPIFNIIDVLLTLQKLSEAIPKAITHLNPNEIIKLFPELKEKIDKIIALVPPLALPVTLKGFVRVLLFLLIGLRQKLCATASISAQLDLADLRAIELHVGITTAAQTFLKGRIAATLNAEGVVIADAAASLKSDIAGAEGVTQTAIDTLSAQVDDILGSLQGSIFEAAADLGLKVDEQRQLGVTIDIAASLNVAIACGRADFDAMLAGLFQTTLPAVRLLQLLELLIKEAGLDHAIPKLELNAGAGIFVAVDALDVVIEPLKIIYAALKLIT